jgi:hypothetical protein
MVVTDVSERNGATTFTVKQSFWSIEKGKRGNARPKTEFST